MKAFAPSRTQSCGLAVPSSLIALDFLCPSCVHFWAPRNKQVRMLQKPAGVGLTPAACPDRALRRGRCSREPVEQTMSGHHTGRFSNSLVCSGGQGMRQLQLLPSSPRRPHRPPSSTPVGWRRLDSSWVASRRGDHHLAPAGGCSSCSQGEQLGRGRVPEITQRRAETPSAASEELWEPPAASLAGNTQLPGTRDRQNPG